MKDVDAYLKFVLVFFLPLVALLVANVPFLLFVVAAAVMTAAVEGLFLFIPGIWFFIATRWCFSLWPGARTYWVKAGLLYIFWVLLLAPCLFVFSAMMAGASMAVADGGVKGWDLLWSELHFTATLLAVSHAVILPWIALSLFIQDWLERRAGNAKDHPAASSAP